MSFRPTPLLLLGITYLGFVLSGCMGLESSGNLGEGSEKLAKDEGIHFTWAPEAGADSAVYMLIVSAGPETKCTYRGETSGLGSSPEGLAYYEYWEVLGRERYQFLGYSQSWRPYAHAGSFNSGHVAYMATEIGINTIVNETIARGSSVVHILGKWGLEPLLAPVESAGRWIDIRCDSHDASIQFFKPDDYAVIDSRHATGGKGFSWEAQSVGIHVNQEDWWSVQTEGRHIHFGSSAIPRSDSPIEPSQEGSVLVDKPSGEESVTLVDGEPIVLGDRYNEPGTYTIHFDWVSTGYTPYMGLLAGFVNESTLGDREADLW